MQNDMPVPSELVIRRCLDPVDYEEIWDLQKEINRKVAEENQNETILMVQHTPVFTLGFHGNRENLLVSEDELRKKGASLFQIERGGDITFHGPGQLVVYPIIRLASRSYGVKEYVRRLEEAVISTCGHYGVNCVRRTDAPGVWCCGDSGLSKICALGIKVKKGVTMHGIALNVDIDPSWFALINPCGFVHGSVTSLKEQMNGREVPDIEEVASVLAEQLQILL